MISVTVKATGYVAAYFRSKPDKTRTQRRHLYYEQAIIKQGGNRRVVDAKGFDKGTVESH